MYDSYRQGMSAAGTALKARWFGMRLPRLYDTAEVSDINGQWPDRKTKMKRNDVFPSKYLRPDDLTGPVSTVVTEIILEEFEDPETGKTKEKAVLYLRGLKPIVLNKTNWAVLEKLYGDESDDWIGCPIRVYVTEVEAFGKLVPAIRLRAPSKASPARDSESEPIADDEFFVPPEAEAETADDIPF